MPNPQTVFKAQGSNAQTSGRYASLRPNSIDFDAINRAALARLPDLCSRWLPDGRRQGREWVARNPRRADREPGSFSVNLETGRWADFACDARGGDPISLAAYLGRVGQGEAARRLAEMLGVSDV